MLCERYFGAQLNNLIINISKGDLVCLVATSPNYHVSLLDVIFLIYGVRCLDKFDSFLLPLHNAFVHPLGISPQSSKRIQESILVSELIILKLIVAFLDGCGYLCIKNSNFVPVDDLNISFTKLDQIFLIIKSPVLVPKVPKTFTNTLAFSVCLALTSLHQVANTAALAFIHSFKHCIREVEFACALIIVMAGWFFV